KAQKIGEQAVENAEGRTLLDHPFHGRSAVRRHLLIDEDDACAVAFMRGPWKLNEHAKGVPVQGRALIVPFLHMPGVAAFAKPLGRPCLKTARTPPVTVTGSKSVPFETIRLFSHGASPLLMSRHVPDACS